VVDDDSTVAEVVQSALAAEHWVEVCLEVGDAFDRIAANPTYDLIFCDMIMPKMSGGDFFEQVKKLHPDLAARFIFMTGGAFTPQTQEFLKTTPNQVLHKPFRVEAIRSVVRACIYDADQLKA
jgi:CheY-like chemotaxis protein